VPRSRARGVARTVYMAMIYHKGKKGERKIKKKHRGTGMRHTTLWQRSQSRTGHKKNARNSSCSDNMGCVFKRKLPTKKSYTDEEYRTKGGVGRHMDVGGVIKKGSQKG